MSKENPYAFGIPVTEEFLKFIKASFTVQEFVDAVGDEEAMASIRGEINQFIKSTPRYWQNKIIREWSKDNSWPLTGNEQVMYYQPDSYKLMTMKEAWPEHYA
jgi:hypothetical protein